MWTSTSFVLFRSTDTWPVSAFSQAPVSAPVRLVDLSLICRCLSQERSEFQVIWGEGGNFEGNWLKAGVAATLLGIHFTECWCGLISKCSLLILSLACMKPYFDVKKIWSLDKVTDSWLHEWCCRNYSLVCGFTFSLLHHLSLPLCGCGWVHVLSVELDLRFIPTVSMLSEKISKRSKI